MTKKKEPLQEAARKRRFAANGEPAFAPGFDKDTLEPGGGVRR
jgi:hypothetical protein